MPVRTAANRTPGTGVRALGSTKFTATGAPPVVGRWASNHGQS